MRVIVTEYLTSELHNHFSTGIVYLYHQFAWHFPIIFHRHYIAVYKRFHKHTLIYHIYDIYGCYDFEPVECLHLFHITYSALFYPFSSP